MKKKFIYLGIVLFSIFFAIPDFVKAEDLKCDYHYYYNGNGLNQGTTALDLKANCVYSFKDDGTLSKHSCSMNYYYKSEENEKIKKISLDNWTATGNYKFVYSNDGVSVKTSVQDSKKCPDYVVGYYDVKSGIFGDNSSFQLYAAIDKQRAHEMIQEWEKVGALAKVHILKNVTISASEDEKKKAYEDIEKWIEELEKASAGNFNVSECEDPTKVITRYSECKTWLNNMKVAIDVMQKTYNDYVYNKIVDENDNRVKKVAKLIDDYEKKVKGFEVTVGDLDCETKLQLGLVDDCNYQPPGGPSSGSDIETSTGTNMCTSCGNGALEDIPMELPMFIRNLILVIQLLVPVALIGLGIYDFIRAVVGSDDKIMKEAQNRFIKRIIAGVLIFFTIAIVKAVFLLIPDNVDILGCVPCFVSDKSHCGTEYVCPPREELTNDSSNKTCYICQDEVGASSQHWTSVKPNGYVSCDELPNESEDTCLHG